MSVSQGGSTKYQGGDVLELMAGAKNYNAFLRREVIRHSGGETHVVDFGAGTGTFAKLLRDDGLEVICIEPDERQLTDLQTDGFESYPGLQSLPAGSVSFLYTLNVLEHIEDDAHALQMIFDALRPDGRCFLYVPAFQVLYSSFDRRLGHFRRYRRRPLAAMFQNKGFVVEQSRYWDSLGFLAALLFRLLLDRNSAVSERTISLYDRFVFPISYVLDRVMGAICGKNVMVVARKPGV